MDQKNFSKPLSLAKVQVTDAFWKKEMELVRTEVIPYQCSGSSTELLYAELPPRR